jgi:hypothetical protein
MQSKGAMMKHQVAVIPVLVALLAFPSLAQERGRTDGPEGSEIGKGGYESSFGGKWSLALDFGASVRTSAPLSGVPLGLPLYFGATATFWLTDWVQLDAHGAYAFDSGRVLALVGPRFRTPTWPVSGSLGLRPGIITEPNVGLRFGLSPVASVDLILARHVLVGLQGSVDLPIAGGSPGLRLGLNAGWRF